MRTLSPDWSDRLRYDRVRQRVVLRDSNVSVACVLTEFAKGGTAIRDFIAKTPDVGRDDVDAAIQYRALEMAELHKDLNKFLGIDDGPVISFVECVAEEADRFRQEGGPFKSMSQACSRIGEDFAELIGACQPGVRDEIRLEGFTRLAARCQVAAEDLKLASRYDGLIDVETDVIGF